MEWKHCCHPVSYTHLDVYKRKVVSHVCTMDEAVWQDAYKMLSASMLDVTDYGDSCLKGTINVQEDGVFVTSVPYEACLLYTSRCV